MSSVQSQWALQSLLQLQHHHLRHGTAPLLRTAVAKVAATPSPSPPPAASTSVGSAPAPLRLTAMPRLLRGCSDPTRVLLLAKRPNGIAGVALRPEAHVPWTGLLTPPPSAKTRLLAAYLQRRGFAMVPAPPASVTRRRPQPPVLLHTNHLVGWKLNDASAAFPVYAHTLAELQRLRSRDMATLQPRHCLLAAEYCKWDNWREVLGEPGWDAFAAEDGAVERLLRDGLRTGAVEDEEGVRPVEVL